MNDQKSPSANEQQNRIIVRSANPKDITPEEAEEIATSIRALDLGCDVQVEAQQRTGYGITLFEVLRIALPGTLVAGGVAAAIAMGKAMGKAFGEEVGKRIAAIVVDWARERFKGRKKGSRRPVYVCIYGPDGTVMSVVIKNATDEPEDRTLQDRQLEQGVKRRTEKPT